MNLFYTDGSANPHDGGSGGWAFVHVKNGRIVKERSGGSPTGQTNHTMELKAILESLRSVQPQTKIQICTDSRNAIGWIMWGWKCKHSHLKVILRQIFSIQATKGLAIKMKHVKGHNGNQFNERADRLANKARKRAIDEGSMGRKVSL